MSLTFSSVSHHWETVMNSAFVFRAYRIRGHLTFQVKCGNYRVVIQVARGEDFGHFYRTSVSNRDVDVVDPTLSLVTLEGKGFRARVQYAVRIYETLSVQQVFKLRQPGDPVDFVAHVVKIAH